MIRPVDVAPLAAEEVAVVAIVAVVDPVADVPSGNPGPERLALSGEIGQRLASGLARLSGTERAAFVLRHFEGMRIEEMSRVLGCQPGAAKHSVFRAVQKLRRALEPALSSVK